MTETVGGNFVRCNVRLDAPAGPGGRTVAITSSSVKIKVPGSVTVKEGKRNAAFNVRTQSVVVPTPVTVSAGVPAGSTADRDVDLVWPGVTITLLPGGLSDLDGPVSTEDGGVEILDVSLSGPAPAGGITVAMDILETSPGSVMGPAVIAEGNVSDLVVYFAGSSMFTRTDTIRARWNALIRLHSILVTPVLPVTDNAMDELLDEGGEADGASADGRSLLNGLVDRAPKVAWIPERRIYGARHTLTLVA